MRTLKSEQWAGLLFVLLLHGAALYGMWRYRLIPAPAEAVTLIVHLINPAAPDQANPPEPPKPKPRSIAPPKVEHAHLAVDTPVVHPDDPVVPPLPPSAPVPVAPVLPLLPVALAGELSVSCPERSPPTYPAHSMRRNEQGRVVLRVELAVDGRISGVTIKIHSGYARLDEAAVNAVKSWRCKPAMRDGVAVPAVALQPFDFIMEGH